MPCAVTLLLILPGSLTNDNQSRREGHLAWLRGAYSSHHDALRGRRLVYLRAQSRERGPAVAADGGEGGWVVY